MGIAESLREPLMKIAQKQKFMRDSLIKRSVTNQLLISDKATFEHLTTTEQNLWTRFETADIYRFQTGEEDTVPEFQYNWTSVYRLQPLGPTLVIPTTPATTPAPAPPTSPPAPAVTHIVQLPQVHHTPHLLHLHREQDPSRPKQQLLVQQTRPILSIYLRYHTSHQRKHKSQLKAKSKNGLQGSQHRGFTIWKRCSRAGASVRKSVTEVRKMSLAELFPPITRNSSSSSTASSK
jgi:hypothetical protein